MDAGFSIEEHSEAGRHRLALKGELDLAAAYELETKLSQLCARESGHVELDLREVTFMDSMGMRSLLTARDMCSEHGAQLSVLAGEGQRRMLEVTGLIDALPWQENAS
jgi:anti-anti-sigma factor